MEIFLILMIPLMGTTLGSLMVFLMRDKVRAQTEKLLLGFASGVMIAASVWSLLIPSMELSERGYGKMNWVPAVVGFAAGILFLLGIDSFVPHLHLDSDKPEGMRSGLSKTTMMLLAVTIHNVPEGMAVGAAVAGQPVRAATVLLLQAHLHWRWVLQYRTSPKERWFQCRLKARE